MRRALQDPRRMTRPSLEQAPKTNKGNPAQSCRRATRTTQLLRIVFATPPAAEEGSADAIVALGAAAAWAGSMHCRGHCSVHPGCVCTLCARAGGDGKDAPAYAC